MATWIIQQGQKKDYGVCIARGEWYSRIASRRNDITPKFFFKKKGLTTIRTLAPICERGWLTIPKVRFGSLRPMGPVA